MAATTHRASTANADTNATTALDSATDLDLAEFGLDVPSGTMVTVELHGNRNGFEFLFERNSDRWIVEGAGSQAELTGVRGPNDPSKPERVPDWIVRVLEEYGVREVSVFR